MIFGIQYVLLGTATSPFDYLLGSYMMEYTNASSLLMSLFFMVYPVAYFFRPVICSIADRFGAHKAVLLLCCLGCSVLYFPFVLVPFYLIDTKNGSNITLFWILTVIHFFGCVCFDAAKSLADALTLNYVSRIESTYGRYRIYSLIFQGVGGLLIGYINTGTSLPNYVAGMLIFVGCFVSLALLTYGWPSEFYVFLNESQLRDEEYMKQRPSLASNADCFKHLCKKVGCCGAYQKSTGETKHPKVEQGTKKYLNVRQQMLIMKQLMQMDHCLPLLMLTLIFSGIVGYSGQQFVQIQVKEVCSTGECNSSVISGYILICIFFCEFAVLIFTDNIRLHYYTSIQVGLVFTAFEYASICYLTQMSPYFYIIAGAHGLHGFLAFLVCVKQGREFANRVELIIPKLNELQILNKDNDIELVKISLAATMIATFVLCHEGVGAILGRLALGTIIQKYGYNVGWLALSTLAALLFLLISIARMVGYATSIGSRLNRIERGLNTAKI